MLQLIRDRSQGLVVGVIVFFICLTFALFGVQQYLDAQGNVVVAEVNGEEVSLTEYQRAFQQLRQRAQAMFGESFNPEMWSGERAKASTLDYVVNEKLLLQAVNEANIQASDAQVAEYIRTSPQFESDGQFSSDLYRQMVRGLGFSELGFEQQVRKDIVVNQLRAGIGASAFTTAEELQRLERYRQQSRDVGFAIIGIEGFREGIEPSDDELKTFLQEKAESYRTEEMMALSYLDLSIESLMADVVINDAESRAFYDSNPANYTATEQRSANHILVQVPRDASDEEVEIAKSKALSLREKVIAGEDFETVAKEHSDDIGSRTDGGETGFFGRGVMAPEFEKATFDLAENDVSELIRTDFGFHIIRLNKIKPGGLKPFEEVKEDVVATLKRERAEALFFEQAEQLSELVYEQPDSLDAAADALNLSIKKTELMSHEALGALFAPRVVDAALEPEVQLEGLNSAPVDVSNGRVVVVRVDDQASSRIPEFEEIETRLKEDFIRDRAGLAVKEHAEALIERLNNGEDRDALVAEAELNWEDVPSANRDSPKLNRAVSRAAFRAAPPEGEHVAYSGVAIGTGDYAIIGVSNVSTPPIEQLNISDISQLRRDVAQERTAEAWRDFVALMKSDADIELFNERL